MNKENNRNESIRNARNLRPGIRYVTNSATAKGGSSHLSQLYNRPDRKEGNKSTKKEK